MEGSFEIINQNYNPMQKFKSIETYSNSTCILTLNFNGNKSKGTGFFIKFKKNNRYERYIMTCYHVVFPEKKINPNNNLEIPYEDVKKKLSFILKERQIKDFMYKNCDVLIIKVFETDDIKDYYFLEYKDIDKNEINDINNKSINIIQYPEDQTKVNIGSGHIKNINLFNYQITHDIPTSGGSSGSPIFLINTLEIIGIHQAGINIKHDNKKEKIDLNGTDIDENQKINTEASNQEVRNLGLFIYPIAETIINDLQYKENIEEENYIYEGEYKNDEKYGYGKLRFKNNEKSIKYIGEWSSNKMNGKGILYYRNGKKNYEGHFLNDKKHGKGRLYDENERIIYNGDFSDDIKQGKGILYHKNGKKEYEGEFNNDNYHGNGKLYYEDGKKEFEGNFENGKKNGDGKFFDKNGNFLEGKWKEDNKEGQFFYHDQINKKIERQNYKKDRRFDTKCQKCIKHILNNKKFYIIVAFVVIIIIIILLLINFLVKCEKGERDKCLTCKRWTRSCGSCNKGYELFKGKCITYQFMVTYSALI